MVALAVVSIATVSNSVTSFSRGILMRFVVGK
jgi:hypothetical protein